MVSGTKTVILDAAEDLIKRFGANGISFQDVSDMVGIRKPSIYHYFPSKSDLILAVLQRENDEFFLNLNRIVSSNATAAHKLKRYVGLFENTFSEGRGGYACLIGMLSAEVAKHDDSVTKVLREFIQGNIRVLTTILEDGRKEGGLAFRGSSEILANLVFSLLEGAMVVVRAQGKCRKYFQITRQLQQILASE